MLSSFFRLLSTTPLPPSVGSETSANATAEMLKMDSGHQHQLLGVKGTLFLFVCLLGVGVGKKSLRPSDIAMSNLDVW